MLTTRPATLADDAVGWAAVGVLGFGAASMLGQRVVGVGSPNCALRAALGIPCPTCGLSTIAARVGHVDVVGAVVHDPVGFALLAVLGVLAAMHVARLVGRPVVVRPIGRLWLVPIVLLIAHWSLTLTGVVHLAPLT